MNTLDNMVQRFLTWKLPDDFGPDAGISFQKPENKDFWPSGTNLLTYTQAKNMLEYVLGKEYDDLIEAYFAAELRAFINEELVKAQQFENFPQALKDAGL